MIKSPKTRRILSLSLMAIGGLLLFLAPEDIWVGSLLMVLGAVLEIAGTLMQRRSQP